MVCIETRLEMLGLELPPEPKVPATVSTPFHWVRVRRERAFLSGHGPLTADGAPAGPFGRVPTEVGLEQAQEAARGAVLSMVSNLQRTLGDLDRIDGWLVLNAFVNAEPGYKWCTLVANSASELLLEIFGPDVGAHARYAPGVSALPLNLPVVVAGELEIRF